MKLSKKFIEDLHKIGEDAFIEKNQWIGKLVPEIIIDNLQKRGISQEDIEGCVVLTVEEATLAMECAQLAYMFASSYRRPEAEADKELANKLAERIEKAEGNK